MKHTRKSKVSIKQNQPHRGITLNQPEVERRVLRLVDRGDAEHLVPGTHVTMDELHYYQLLGRRLQARAVTSAFAGLFRALVRPLRGLAAATARVSRETAAIRQLSALDDYLLADLGIQRGQIRAAVTGLLDRQTATAPDTGVQSAHTQSTAAAVEPPARAA